MRYERVIPVVMLLVITVCAGAAPSPAQEVQPGNGRPSSDKVKIRQQDAMFIAGQDPTEPSTPPPGIAIAPGGENHMFKFLSSEMRGQVVKGAPYSADVTTETIQTLADGNRIVRNNAAKIYRDGEGRTRRDQTLGAIGPFAVDGAPLQTSFINDPIAGANYILDPKAHVAHRMVLTSAAGPGALAKPGIAVAGLPRSDLVYIRKPHSEAEVRKETLPKQTMEGVEVEGVRETRTIAAGQIGNERPIEIVTERWYSPDLQVVVMRKTSDPISGQTTYRLTNINRTEPAHSLFEVPSDYKVEDGPSIRGMLLPKHH